GFPRSTLLKYCDFHGTLTPKLYLFRMPYPLPFVKGAECPDCGPPHGDQAFGCGGVRATEIQ
ncbi:MAG: hypothetical protein ACPHGY_05585, partial [Rhodospirillaceae bacterium]